MVVLSLPGGTIDLLRSCLFVPGASVHEPFKVINLGQVGPSLVDLGPEDGSMAWGGDVKPVKGGEEKPVEDEEENLVEGEAKSCLIYPATVEGDYLPVDVSLPDDVLTTGQEELGGGSNRLL